MNQIYRKLFSYLSICGFTVSICEYIAGFNYRFAGATAYTFAPLFVVWIAVVAPIYVLDRKLLRSSTFIFWNGIPQAMSRPAILVHRALVLLALASMAWALAHMNHGGPAIENGKYVLENNGKIFRVINRSEYLSVSAAKLRSYAAASALLYFVPMMYWSFKAGVRIPKLSRKQERDS